MWKAVKKRCSCIVRLIVSEMKILAYKLKLANAEQSIYSQRWIPCRLCELVLGIWSGRVNEKRLGGHQEPATDHRHASKSGDNL